MCSWSLTCFVHFAKSFWPNRRFGNLRIFAIPKIRQGLKRFSIYFILSGPSRNLSLCDPIWVPPMICMSKCLERVRTPDQQCCKILMSLPEAVGTFPSWSISLPGMPLRCRRSASTRAFRRWMARPRHRCIDASIQPCGKLRDMASCCAGGKLRDVEWEKSREGWEKRLRTREEKESSKLTAQSNHPKTVKHYEKTNQNQAGLITSKEQPNNQTLSKAEWQTSADRK